MTGQLLALNENFQMQMKQNEEQKQVIAGLQKQIELLRKENAALKEQKKLSNKQRFDGKSQKLSFKHRGSASREADKEDFTAVPLPAFLRRRRKRTFRPPPRGNRNGHTAKACPTSV